MADHIRFWSGLVPRQAEQRKLAAVFTVNSLGNGMYLPVALLYLTKAGHWSGARVGLAFTVASLMVVASSMVTGHLSDRRSPRRVAAVLLAGEGVATAGLCVMRWLPSYPLLLGLLAVDAAASFGGRSAWGVLIAQAGGDDRVTLRAHLRALSNVATALGAVIAGAAEQAGTTAVYSVLILANAASFVAAAALLLRLPPGRPVPRSPASRRMTALRDRRYVLACCLNVPLNWQYGALSIVLPLWVIDRTSAPRWAAGGALALNTVLVAVLQVRASRIVARPDGAARSLRLAGPMFMLSMAGLAATSHLTAIWALAVILAAVAVHTLGELWHAAAAFEIPYAAAPKHVIGEYQGVFETARGISTSLMPAVLTLMCISWGSPGWVSMGGIFLLSSLGIAILVSGGGRAAVAAGAAGGRPAAQVP